MPEISVVADLLGIITVVITAGVGLVSLTWRVLSKYARPTDALIDTLTPTVNGTARPPPFMSFEGSSCPHDKLQRLTRALSSASQSRRLASLESDERGDVFDALLADLEELQFLQPGELLDGRYRLVRLMSRGLRSHVWEAVDEEQGRRRIVIKVLKYSFCSVKGSLDGFLKAARLLQNFDHCKHRPVVSDVRAPAPDLPDDYIAYYAMNHVHGVTLEDYVLDCASRRTQQQWLSFSVELTEKLMELARSVADMHKAHVVHCDIQPSNILVCLDEQGQMKHCCLMDLDTCSSTRKATRSGEKEKGLSDGSILDERGLGYIAPELLQGHSAQAAHADIFSLARVVTFVFRGKQLPHPYALSSPELIRNLYCPPRLREPLFKATNISPLQRQINMGVFIDEVEAALAHERNAPAHTRWIVLCSAERPNIVRTLLYAFMGALVPMLLVRPWLAAHKWVHLSDTFSIGVFHAWLGSMVWGVFITSGFLVYQTLLEQTHLKRSSVSGYVLAGLCGGLGGFLGGVLCAVLGATITNACALEALGWIAKGSEQCMTVNEQGLLKVLYTLATNLFWAYPLTGAFTGIGLGLWLNLKVNELSAAKMAQVLPVPKRRFDANVFPLRASTHFVFKSWPSHLILLLPVAAAALGPWVFVKIDAHDFTQTWRALGEGTVHYISAVGLGVGYFLGVAPRARR